MKHLLIATKNPGKFSEISEVLSGLPLRLLSLNDLGFTDDVEETAETHEENALLKARYFFEKTNDLLKNYVSRRKLQNSAVNASRLLAVSSSDTASSPVQRSRSNFAICSRKIVFQQVVNMPTLGEDSGIYVDAFPGELGVKTRRFRDKHAASDEEWVDYFLKEMEKIPDEKRGAKFVCHAALILNGGEPHFFSGECRGVITRKLEAPLKAGIPLSSCFRPEGFSKVYTALSTEEKNSISHRGRAIRAVKEFLVDVIASMAK